MLPRKQIEAPFRHAQKRLIAEDALRAASPYDSPEYNRARDLGALWAGRIDDYRFVLREPGNTLLPTPAPGPDGVG
jgi:hypothetical protein